MVGFDPEVVGLAPIGLVLLLSLRSLQQVVVFAVAPAAHIDGAVGRVLLLFWVVAVL